MDKIRILISTSSGFKKREGISTVIYDYFSRFNKDLFEIHIVVDGEYNTDLIDLFRESGIIVDFLHSRKKELKKYIADLDKLFKSKKFDVLYANGSSALMAIELTVAAINGCRIRVVHSHNTTCDYKKIDRVLRPYFYFLCTDAFACGQEAGKWLFGKRNFTIIRNGRDISKYSFDEVKRRKVRQQMKVSDDCLLVGHVGNFNQQKNHHFVLEVFKEIIGLKENAKLYLIGSGVLLDEIKQLASEMGISDKVVFTGSISNVDEMLQAMDVMFLPSLHEGLPLVVVEWQIAGLPCLISDNVTRECAFTNLVQFKSLDSSSIEWAKDVIGLSKMNRRKEAIEAYGKALESGYDINRSVAELQQLFLDLLNN